MLRELKTFLAVVRSGTFAGAGARIGLTQSAVSAQMQKLEETLGAPLFERTGRSASLNAAGRDAIPLAEQILSLFSEMATRISSPVLRGLLRVGAIQSAQAGLLPEALALLRNEHEQVTVRVVAGSSLQLIGHVDSGEIDAALMVKPPFELPRELFWHPLSSEPFALIVPDSEDTGDWQALLTERNFIRYDRTSFGGRVVDKFLRRHHLQTHDVIEIEDVGTIVRMVSHGLGVSLVPVSDPATLPRNVRVLELDDPAFCREVGLVGRTESDRHGLVHGFTECIVRSTRDRTPVSDRRREARE